MQTDEFLKVSEASVRLWTIFLESIMRNIKPQKFKAIVIFWSQPTFSIKNQKVNILGFAAQKISVAMTEHGCSNRNAGIVVCKPMGVSVC